MKLTIVIFAFSVLFISCNSGNNKTDSKRIWEYKVLYAEGTPIKGVKKVPVGIADLGSEDLSASKEIYVSEEALNVLGADGWELVNSYLENETVFPGLIELLGSDHMPPPKPSSNVRPSRLVLIFKRAK